MGSMSIWHWLVVLVVVLLLFGRGKVSDLMGDVAKGIKSFKKGMADDEETVAKAPPEAPRPLPPHQSTASAPAATEAEKKAV